MSNEKTMVILLTVGLMKKIYLYKMSYFPDSYTRSKNKIKVKIDFSNDATKSDLKSATSFNTWTFSKNAYLASLRYL